MFHPQGPSFGELVRQALSSTERGYDLLAPKFDHTPFRTPDEILRPVAEFLKSGPPIEWALDLCCGTGAAMEMLAPLCRTALVGVDRSQEMLKVAQCNLKGAAPLWVRTDALELPFVGVFDLVVCFGAFGHILPAEESQFVEQVAQVLRPGGRFVFVTAPLPRKCSRGYWLAQAFNSAMWIRNALLRPPFIMYYLTFLLPQACSTLQSHGFRVVVHENLCNAPFRRLALVEATKSA